MKKALQNKLNTPIPDSLREGIKLKSKPRGSKAWPFLVPVALSMVLAYFGNQELKKIERIEAQEERIMDEFVQDMNEFDYELDDEIASYL